MSREVCMAGWLQEKRLKKRASFIGRKKTFVCGPQQWFVLCVHNDKAPFLEAYLAETHVLSHHPLKSIDLLAVAYVNVGIDDDRCFVIGFGDLDRKPLSLVAQDTSERDDWKTMLTFKLNEIGALRAQTNVYGPLPQVSKSIREASEDQTADIVSADAGRASTSEAPPSREEEEEEGSSLREERTREQIYGRICDSAAPALPLRSAADGCSEGSSSSDSTPTDEEDCTAQEDTTECKRLGSCETEEAPPLPSRPQPSPVGRGAGRESTDSFELLMYDFVRSRVAPSTALPTDGAVRVSTAIPAADSTSSVACEAAPHLYENVEKFANDAESSDLEAGGSSEVYERYQSVRHRVSLDIPDESASSSRLESANQMPPPPPRPPPTDQSQTARHSIYSTPRLDRQASLPAVANQNKPRATTANQHSAAPPRLANRSASMLSANQRPRPFDDDVCMSSPAPPPPPPPRNRRATTLGEERLTLKEREVLSLQVEQKSTGIRLSLPFDAAARDLALVQHDGLVWVAGWAISQNRTISAALHVGDLVLRIGSVQVTKLAEANTAIFSHQPGGSVEFLVRRLPFGHAFALKRSRNHEDLGIVLEEDGAQLVRVETGSVAFGAGVRSRLGAPGGGGDSPASVSEVNGRFVGWRAEKGSIPHRLNAIGLDISVVLQPAHFLAALKQQLKQRKNWKSFSL